MSWLEENDLVTKKAESNPLEKVIEERTCAYAKRFGWTSMKFTSPGNRSVPDRIFTRYPGKIVFIEFKRLGEKPTPKQTLKIDWLRKQGFKVFVVDSIELGREVFDELQQEGLS